MGYSSYTSFQWYKDGIAILDAIDSNYIATTSGAYTLRAYNDFSSRNPRVNYNLYIIFP